MAHNFYTIGLEQVSRSERDTTDALIKLFCRGGGDSFKIKLFNSVILLLFCDVEEFENA